MIASIAGTAEAQRPVRIPFPQDDGTLTPYTFELGYPLVMLVYDSVMWRDANGVPRPWLARSVRNRGRRVTIRLREGVRWHDGRRLTADDVAFTLRHFRRRFHPRFTPQLDAVTSVRATGPLRVELRLRHPAPGFRDQPLSDVPILPRHLWASLPRERLAPPGRPVGSGPYRLVDHDRGSGYRFRANGTYFRGRPAVDAIDVPVIREVTDTFNALDRGSADMIPVSLPPDARRRLDELGVEVARGPLYTGTVLMFNVRRPPFDRVEVRREVARAIDRQRMVRALPGAVAADRGYLHPMSRWAPDAPVPQPPRGTAVATLPPVTILAPDGDPVRLEAGRQVVLALRRAGLRASVRSLSARALAAAVGQDGAPPQFEAAIWSSPPLASYDPDFLRVVFGAGMPLNYSGYRSGRFERLAARVAATAGREARRAAVGEELRLLAADLPVVPLFFQEGAFAYRRAAHTGWIFVRGTGIFDKRSFLRAAPPRMQRSEPPAERAGGSSLGVFGWLAIASLVAAVAVAALASGRRRG